MIRGSLPAAAFILASGALLHAQETASLQTVLQRAGRYVDDFQKQLSNIVAEETYDQTVDRPSPTLGGFTAVTLQRRQLKSDLLLIRPEAGISWVQFRDVFEVDGRPVRDREQRLTSLFFQRATSTLQRVARIRRESARYNIGNVNRTMNIPVLPLAVLDADAQPRFAFSVAGNENRPRDRSRDLPASPQFRASSEMWIVSFQEKREPTLVRSEPDGRNLFSRGRLWIEPSSGQVLMAEMIVENGPVRAQVTVSYQSEPLLDFLVPVEMREKYTRKDDRREIAGTATYGRFRQFQVQVDERVEPIK